MAITFGLDISHHQDLSLDLAAARRDGCEFVFIKAGEGGSLVDDEFAANLAEARAAGQLVGAYWFVRANATAAAHVALMRRVVPLDVPVILDVERPASGAPPTLAQARAVLDATRAAGYRTPLSYIPLWFWRDVWGRPSLAGWPPLWSSRYPDNIVGTLASEWAQVPASYWTGFGGLDVAVLQFTSSARIAGYQPLDANAFRGDRAQLAALLGGQNPEVPDMDANQDQLHREMHVELTGSAAPIFPGAGYVSLRALVKGLVDSIGTLTAMVNKQSSNSATEVAAALLPALVPVVKEALAEVESDDPAVFAQAVSDRLAALLKGGGQ